MHQGAIRALRALANDRSLGRNRHCQVGLRIGDIRDLGDRSDRIVDAIDDGPVLQIAR